MRFRLSTPPVLNFCICSLMLASLMSANWPQWRGPDRDGISKETGLLKVWPEAGPPLVWKVDNLGDGYSTPAVIGDRIYLVSNKGLENEFVQALDIKDGKQVWERRIGNVGEPKQQPNYPGARSTPTIDGDMLYALGSDGDLACIDRNTGEIRWNKNVRKEYNGKPGEWAYSESPLIDGDAVVVTPGGEEATLVALDKKTGELIRKMPVPGGEEAGYASIVISDAAGVKQYVQFLAKGVVGIDANTGKFLWRYDRTAQGSPANIGTPVVKDDMVYTGAHRAGAGAIKLLQTAEGLEYDEIYFGPQYPSAIGGAVLVGDYLYGTNRTTTTCVKFDSGDVVWTEERGMAPSSLCYADGHLYLHSEGSNEVGLIEATPDGYRENGRFTPEGTPDKGQSKSWSYPVVADGRLYIHDWGTLWCYDVKAK
jgi:outer membrane protein assembly factor BamB